MEIIISKIVRLLELIFLPKLCTSYRLFLSKIMRILEIIKQKEVQLCQKGGGG